MLSRPTPAQGLFPRLRISLACAGLLDVIFHQLWRMRLRATHDQITRRPKVAGRIFLFHSRKFDKDLLRRLLTHDAHEIPRRCGGWNVDNPLHILWSYREIFEAPGKCDTDLWQPF